MKLVFFTGAGVSVASGLGTFRGQEGALWDKYDLNVVCNFNTVVENKDAVFEFYNTRKELYADAQPNEAHHFIKRLIDKHGGTVITTNVDLLHEAAGTQALHLHGRMDRQQCLTCKSQWDIGRALFDKDALCPICFAKGTTKPGVVFFGEHAPEYEKLYDIAFNATGGLLKIVMGTSLHVVGPGMLGCGIGTTILVDPNPPDDADEYFDAVIKVNAEDAEREVTAYINDFLKTAP